jgi:hypothetical protein
MIATGGDGIPDYGSWILARPNPNAAASFRQVRVLASVAAWFSLRYNR